MLKGLCLGLVTYGLGLSLGLEGSGLGLGFEGWLLRSWPWDFGLYYITANNISKIQGMADISSLYPASTQEPSLPIGATFWRELRLSQKLWQLEEVLEGPQNVCSYVAKEPNLAVDDLEHFSRYAQILYTQKRTGVL